MRTLSERLGGAKSDATKSVCGLRRPLPAAMNRLSDDNDPYAVEEPSDEDPALSR